MVVLILKTHRKCVASGRPISPGLDVFIQAAGQVDRERNYRKRGNRNKGGKVCLLGVLRNIDSLYLSLQERRTYHRLIFKLMPAECWWFLIRWVSH